MKKLFTLLTAIILCSGMVVQAQGKILPKKPGQPIVQKSLTNKTKTPSVSNRRNAPQGPWTYTYSWSWSDFRTSSDEYKKLCSSGSLDAYMYDWIDNDGNDIWIYLAFDRTKAGTYTYNNANYVMPAKGTYTIQDDMEEWAMSDWNAAWDGEHYNESMFYDPSASNYNGDGGFYLVTGSANVTEGATGPYITISNVALSYGNGYGSWYDFGGGNSFTIGSPAVYRAVSVVSNSNTMGTVDYVMKSGYVYTTNITDWKNGSVYTLTAEPKSGYRFVCWKKGSTQISTNATTDVTIDGDATYTAYFESAGPTFTLTLDVTSNGTVTVRDADLDNALVTFTNGEAKVGERHNISITATPATGYHLTSVTLGEELINNLNQTFEISEDITLSVVFEPDVYTITYKDKGNGEFTGTHGANHPTTHTYGTATALVNPTRESYTFGGWYTNSACTGAAITSIGATAYTSAPTLYAKWRGAITTSVSPSNYGTVTAGGTYDLNTNITLTATSANDRYYKFDHWLKDGNSYAGGATITPTVTANATYTAVFRQASNGTITGLSNNNSYGTVTVSPSGEQNGGTAVILTPVANEGYTFTQWSDGNTDNPRTVYVDGDAEYTAQFAEGVNINVQSYSFRDATSSSVFYFRGLTDDYQFVLFVNSSSVTGNYTQANLHSSYTNKIVDHGTDVSITSASFSVTSDASNYYLSGYFVGSNGKRYNITTWHEKPRTNFSEDEDNDYETSFSSIGGIALQSDGSYLINATTSTDNGQYVYTTEMDFIVDSERQHGSEKIPSGFYFINRSGAAGTVKGVNSNPYLDPPTYQGYAEIQGSYVREYYYAWGEINMYWHWLLCDGYVRVTNVNEQYYIYVRGLNSRYYQAYYTIGTAPFDVDITGDANGSVDIAYYASNWGTTVHYEEGVNEFFSGNMLTLTPQADDGYEFWRWSDESEEVETSAYGASRNVTVSGNLTLQAIFREAAATYTVTFNDYDDSQIQTGNVEENTQPTIASDPTRADDVANNTAYTFAGWKSSVDDQIYTTENLPVATAEVTYTAQYEPYFLLLDDKTDNNDAYYTALGDKKGEKLNVKYIRSFTKDTWAVFSLPFNYSFQNPDNNTFREQVYYLISAKYTSDGYLTLNCMPNTYRIEANKPYILIPKADIDNPTFKGVKMQSVAHNYYTAPNTEGIGTGVEFRNTTERETLARDKRVIYIKGANNQLYYPSMSVDTWMRPFRGYFYLNVTPEQIQYTPARVRLVTPEGEYIEQAPDTDQPAAVETKKYIENGILIIERAGMKYDAQGHIIK